MLNVVWQMENMKIERDAFNNFCPWALLVLSSPTERKDPFPRETFALLVRLFQPSATFSHHLLTHTHTDAVSATITLSTCIIDWLELWPNRPNFAVIHPPDSKKFRLWALHTHIEPIESIFDLTWGLKIVGAGFFTGKIRRNNRMIMITSQMTLFEGVKSIPNLSVGIFRSESFCWKQDELPIGKAPKFTPIRSMTIEHHR